MKGLPPTLLYERSSSDSTLWKVFLRPYSMKGLPPTLIYERSSSDSTQYCLHTFYTYIDYQKHNPPPPPSSSSSVCNHKVCVSVERPFLSDAANRFKSLGRVKTGQYILFCVCQCDNHWKGKSHMCIILSSRSVHVRGLIFPIIGDSIKKQQQSLEKSA